MAFKVVIPARYASSRLPAKPLLDIGGAPMVIRVVEQAIKSGANEIIVATDHPEIAEVVKKYGYQSIMTRQDHPSGTDRIAEVASKLGWAKEEIVVNVQGDEPLIDPQLIREVAQNLAQHPNASIATACHSIHDKLEMFDPNIVKVVFDKDGYAMYFSRAPIPYARDAFAEQQPIPQHMLVHRHIGIYAYKVDFLSGYPSLPQSSIEQYEALEQLRALWHGYKISIFESQYDPAKGVDTELDLAKVRDLYIAGGLRRLVKPNNFNF